MADYLTDAFIRLRQKLKAVSGRMLPDADDAEDILQDSFVRLWQRKYPLQSEKEAGALLMRTVCNASLNERRRKRPVALETDLAEEPPEREGLASRPEAYRNKMLATFRQNARETRACGSAPEWEEHLFGAYREMDELCRRHGIRFVVYKAPLLQEFERNLPAETQNRIAVYEQRLRDMHIEYVKPQIELDERYFFDNVHLTMPGAKLFTADLFRLLAP